MPPRRRELLTATAALALGGGAVGYTQRRRLRRLPAIYDLHRIRSKPLPARPAPFVVPDSHLEASRNRLDELIATMRERGISENQNGYLTIDDVLSRRERALHADSSIEKASELRSGRRYAAAIIEHHQYQAGEWSHADARTILDAFETQFEEASLDYTLTPGSRLVATFHAAEHAREDARDLYNQADKWMSPDAPLTRGRIEAAHAYLDLATALVADGNDGNGESRKAELRRLAKRLGTEIDESLLNVRHGPTDIARRAVLEGGPAGLLQGSASEKLTESPDQPASAVAVRFRDRALATVAVKDGEHAIFQGTTDISDIEQAKEDALKAIDAIPEAQSTDPLGRLFHAFAVWVAEKADRRVNAVLESANSESRYWKIKHEPAYLGYRTAAEVARAVPDMIDRASTI